MIQFSFFSLLEIIKMKILKNPLWKKVKLIMISSKKIILNLIGTWQEKPLVKWNGKKDRFKISYLITLHWGDNEVGDIIMLVTLSGNRTSARVNFWRTMLSLNFLKTSHRILQFHAIYCSSWWWCVHRCSRCSRAASKR